MKKSKEYLVLLSSFTLLILSLFLINIKSASASSDVAFPSDAGFINVKTQYGAKGDGVTDDTAALQSAIKAATKGQTVYLPAGTYIVSAPLYWYDSSGKWRAWIRFQGQNQASTIIKLKNNVFTNGNCDPNAYHDQGSGGNCRAVLYTATSYNYNFPTTWGNGEDAYMNFIQDLTVDVGSGNPGAIGVDFLASNSGAMRNVTVRSSDGQGRFGISLSRSGGGDGGGPGLLKNITITGFDYGIQAGYSSEVGYTLEHITLSGQRTAGIWNRNFSLWIRDLKSNNSVPAVINNGSGSMTILDGQFSGGSSGSNAIEQNGSVMFARNISSSGYKAAIGKNGVSQTGASVTEWTSKASQNLFSSSATSLNLPVKETPEYTNNDFSQWANVKNYSGSNDSQKINAAMASGKPVIYFPHGKYTLTETIHIPSSVHLIEGMGSSLVGSGAKQNPVFSCDATSGGPIILRNFIYDKYTLGGGPMSVTNNCTVSFAILDVFDFERYLGNSTGDFFTENTAIPGGMWFHNPAGHYWGRQVNVESGSNHLEFDGTTAWIFGYKTEGPGGGNGNFYAHNNAKVEMLGAFNSLHAANSGIGYVINDASVSIGGLVTRTGYTPTVRETRSGITKEFLKDNSWNGDGVAFGLFSATNSSNPVVTTPITSETPISTNPATSKFTVGQRVQTTSNLNVRSIPSATGTLLGTQPLGSLGTIVDGGVSADGYYWWNVDFDNAPDGYSAENYLTAYTAPNNNTPAPVSTGTTYTPTPVVNFNQTSQSTIQGLNSVVSNMLKSYQASSYVQQGGTVDGQTLIDILNNIVQKYVNMLNLASNTGTGSGGNTTQTTVPNISNSKTSLSAQDVLRPSQCSSWDAIDRGYASALIKGKSTTGKYNMVTGQLYVNVGDEISYFWCGANASKISSSYTIDSPDTCSNTNGSTGPLSWVANTASGESSSVVQACQAGHTYTITYTVQGGVGNFTDNDSLVVEVIPLGGSLSQYATGGITFDTMTLNPSPIVVKQGSSVNVSGSYHATFLTGNPVMDMSFLTPVTLNLPAGVTVKTTPPSITALSLSANPTFSYVVTADPTVVPGSYPIAFTFIGGAGPVTQTKAETSTVLNVLPADGSALSGATSYASLNLITSSYKVGQPWTLKLSSNIPNTSFSFCGSHNGSVGGCAPNFGTTDSLGNWTTSGTFTSADLGSWSEWAEFPSGAKTGFTTFTVK